MARECREYNRAVDAGRMYDDGLCRWALCYCRYTAYACYIHLSQTTYRERRYYDGHPAYGRVVLRKIRAHYFHQHSRCDAPGVLGSQLGCVGAFRFSVVRWDGLPDFCQKLLWQGGGDALRRPGVTRCGAASGSASQRGVCPGVGSTTAKSPMEDSSSPSFNAMWQLCGSPS